MPSRLCVLASSVHWINLELDIKRFRYSKFGYTRLQVTICFILCSQCLAHDSPGVNHQAHCPRLAIWIKRCLSSAKRTFTCRRRKFLLLSYPPLLVQLNCSCLHWHPLNAHLWIITHPKLWSFNVPAHNVAACYKALSNFSNAFLHFTASSSAASNFWQPKRSKAPFPCSEKANHTQVINNFLIFSLMLE